MTGALRTTALRFAATPVRRLLHKRTVVRSARMPFGGRAEFWALDFDGVICDSCGESSLSAWTAAESVWPQLLKTEASLARKNEIMEQMRVIRPVVETGFENIVLIRCLLEGISTEEILQNWTAILPRCMEQWDLNRRELVELFGSTRDEWMERDMASWLAPNRIFDGLPEALSTLLERAEVYIVTTKQARFTDALLRDMADLHFPFEKILSTTVSGQPKAEILAQLQKDHPHEHCLFVEDKISTLEKVGADASLRDWKLYLADWGYNTEAERTRARRNPRIDVIDLKHFAAILKNGVTSAVTSKE